VTGNVERPFVVV